MAKEAFQPTVIVDDNVPRWMVFWIGIIVLTVIVGWVVWSKPPERDLIDRPRAKHLKLEDAVSVLHYGNLSRGDPVRWDQDFLVSDDVFIYIGGYTVIDDVVGYGGFINVATDNELSEVEVDLDEIFAGRKILHTWTGNHLQHPHDRQLSLRRGEYPLVVMVEARDNWHGGNLNPYRPPDTYDRRRFYY